MTPAGAAVGGAAADLNSLFAAAEALAERLRANDENASQTITTLAEKLKKEAEPPTIAISLAPPSALPVTSGGESPAAGAVPGASLTRLGRSILQFIQRRPNKRQIALTILTLGLASCGVLNGWLVEHVGGQIPINPPFFGAAVLALGLVDVLLVGLFASVINRCRVQAPEWPVGIPDRGPATVILILCYWTMVFAFAQINGYFGLAEEGWRGVYEAFLTVATLEHTNFRFVKEWYRFIAGIGILSVLLLFFVCFPLLIGRLVMFKGETAGPIGTRLNMTSTRKVRWSVNKDGVQQPPESESLSWTVEEIAEMSLLENPRT